LDRSAGKGNGLIIKNHRATQMKGTVEK